MAGTASTLTEYINPAEQQHFFSRISGWLSGNNDAIYKGCTLIDISECGGALLIPKNLVIPHNIFDLIIQDTDNSKTTIVRAELRWSDIDHSETYIKIGFNLTNDTISKRRAISHIIKQARRMDNIDFECSLIF